MPSVSSRIGVGPPMLPFARSHPWRTLVAASLVFAGASPLAGEDSAKAPDRVVLRDGTVRTGELVACAGGGCRIEGGEPIARADVAAVEFAGAPVSGAAGARDQVVLRSGERRETTVFAIDPDAVHTDSGTRARRDVAAVLFAAGADGGAVGGGSADDGPPPAGEPEPPAPPAPPPSPAPLSPPPPAPAPTTGDGGERGALWTGVCHASHVVVDGECRSEVLVQEDLRLREWRRPLLMAASGGVRRVGSQIWLEPEGTTLHNEYRLDCGPAGSAAGSGQVQFDAGDRNLHASTIWLKEADVDLTPLLGFDVPRSGGFYFVGHGGNIDEDYPVVYSRPDGSSSNETSGYLGCAAGGPPNFPGRIDPQLRTLDGGRMIGAFSTPWMNGTYSAAWSICREGAACPPSPPGGGDEPFDPCGRAGQQAALRDTCRAQLAALAAALEPALADYQERTAAAEANRQAFADAQAICQIYDIAQQVLEAILTGGAGPAAEAARSLLYLRGVIDKTMRGDLASMLYPSQVKTFLQHYGRAKAVWFELTADDLSRMRSRHQACSGKVPIETYLGAQRFLENLEAAKSIWDGRVAPGMNDLRTKGLECAWWDHAAWRACLADAECRGVPPDCGPEPSLEGVVAP